MDKLPVSSFENPNSILIIHIKVKGKLFLKEVKEN